MSVPLERIPVNMFASMKMVPTPAHVTMGTAWIVTDKAAQVRNVFYHAPSHCGVNTLVLTVRGHHDSADNCIMYVM